MNDQHTDRQNHPIPEQALGLGLSIGTGVGVALGVAFGNLAAGIGVGIAVGMGLAALRWHQGRATRNRS